MNTKKRLLPVVIVSVFFLAFLFVGYTVYKDYGVSTDEPTSYLRGRVNYQRLMGGSLAQFQADCAKMVNENVCYYPPLFDMILYRAAPYGDSGPLLLRKNGVWTEPPTDTPVIYYRRHLVTFTFFAISVFVFFLTGMKIFKDWKIGLLGSLFLILSPRILGASFYNPKDIPFLSAYIISIYTLLLFLEKKTFLRAALHGVAAAVLCSIRMPGLIILPVTILFILFDLNISRPAKNAVVKAAGLLLAFLIVTAGLVFLFTPVLYTDPVGNYLKIFNIMKQYPWNGFQLYLGQDISNRIPWHYSIVWFLISSPILYLVLFVIGAGALVFRTARARTKVQFQSLRGLYLVLACAILPVIAVIVLKSTLYTSNRQMYFCYPALLLISLDGFGEIYGFFKRKVLRGQVWVGLILIMGLAYPAYFMVRYHPYENFYFNILAGSNLSIIKQRFTLDSWMMTSKEALEYLLKTNSSGLVSVTFLDGAPRSVFLLSAADRKRLVINDTDTPMYIVNEYYYSQNEKISGGEVYYSVRIGDADIMTIYKMDNPQ